MSTTTYVLVAKKKIFNVLWLKEVHITKTCLYIFDPLRSHFHIVKLVFTGAFIIFPIYAQKHIVGTH